MESRSRLRAGGGSAGGAGAPELVGQNSTSSKPPPTRAENVLRSRISPSDNSLLGRVGPGASGTRAFVVKLALARHGGAKYGNLRSAAKQIECRQRRNPGVRSRKGWIQRAEARRRGRGRGAA